MPKISLILFLLTGLQSLAGMPERELRMTYSVDSTEVNQSLGQGQAKVVVYVKNNGFEEGETIQYGFDGSNSFAQLDKALSFDFNFNSGKHFLQFYAPQKTKMEEITTGQLQFKARTTTYLSIYFNELDNGPVLMKKPVIYLYPEEKTDVSVKLDIKGEPIFLYPAYKNEWKFEATPSGDLIFGDKTYHYLFWEAAQNRVFSGEELQSGYNVKRDEVVAFLEEKLTQAGLSSQEQADFITFWAPQLAANELNFVRFEFNEVCNRYAELDITPAPDHIYRIYMTWMPIESELDVVPQTIEVMNREGFCVLEWGGAEITSIDRPN